MAQENTELYSASEQIKSLNILMDITRSRFVYSYSFLQEASKDFIVAFLKDNCRQHYDQVDKLLNISRDLRSQVWPETLREYKIDSHNKLIQLIEDILETVHFFENIQKERKIIINRTPMSPIFKYKLPKYDGSSDSKLHVYQYWNHIQKIQEDGQLTENQIIKLIMSSLEGRAKSKFNLIDEAKLTLDSIHSVLVNWFGNKISILVQIIAQIESIGMIPEGSLENDSEILEKCRALYAIIIKIKALKARPELLENSLLSASLTCILPRSVRGDFSRKLNETPCIIEAFTLILNRLHMEAVKSQEYESTKFGGLKPENDYCEEENSEKFFTEIADSSSDEEETGRVDDEKEEFQYFSHVNVAQDIENDVSDSEAENEQDLEEGEVVSDGEMETEHVPITDPEQQDDTDDTDSEVSLDDEDEEGPLDDTVADPDWEDISDATSEED